MHLKWSGGPHIRCSEYFSHLHYGQPGLRMMESNSNILLRFKRPGAAIQLAQWWNEVDVSRRLSRLDRVMAIYGHHLPPLKDQAMEPRLFSPVPIVSLPLAPSASTTAETETETACNSSCHEL